MKRMRTSHSRAQCEHHVFKRMWTPVNGWLLQVRAETGNERDRALFGNTFRSALFFLQSQTYLFVNKMLSAGTSISDFLCCFYYFEFESSSIA